jgi:phosphate starvation-inducible PhoH-like protein
MAKRSSRSTSTAPQNDTKVTRLFERGWNPLDHFGGAAGEERDQSYRRTVRPQSENQRRLVEAIAAHHLTLALGPAGTGKTYLAVTAAVEAFEGGKVSRIVLTRPAV